MYSTMARVYSLIKGFMRLFSGEGSMATIIQCHRNIENCLEYHPGAFSFENRGVFFCHNYEITEVSVFLLH